MFCAQKIVEACVYILSEEQISELYCPPNVDEANRDVVFTLNDKEEAQLRHRETDLLQIYYILFLGYFKEKPVQLKPDLKAIKNDFEYVRKRYFSNSSCKLVSLTPNQKYKIYKKIFSVVEIKKFDADLEKKIEEFANHSVVNQSLPIALFDELLDWLRINSVEIPSYNKLQWLVTVTFNAEKNRVLSVVNRILSLDVQDMFKRFLVDAEQKQIFKYIRYEGRDFSKPELNKEFDAFDTLSKLIKDVFPLISKLNIPAVRIKYYAELFSELSLSRHKKRNDAEFNLYLACFIYYRYRSLIDYLADAFTYHVNLIEKDARQSANEKILKIKSSMDDLMVEGAKILSFFSARSDYKFKTLAQANKSAAEILSDESLNNLIRHMSRSKLEKDVYFWEYVDKCKEKISGVLRSIVFRLNFIDSAELGLLFRQIETLKSEIGEVGHVKSIDKRLSKKTNEYLHDEDNKLISNRAEYHLYRLVSQRLFDRHWLLRDSIRYQPIEEMLIAEDKVEALSDDINAETIKRNLSGLLDERFETLDELLTLVPQRVQSKENESLILERNGGEHSWTIKKIKGQEAVNHKTFDLLSKTDISRVIFKVAQDTGFLDDIRHRTGKKRPEYFEEKLIACLIANATRQGVYKMADLCEFSHDTLLRFQQNYLSLESLRKACDTVSNSISKLEIFSHYNYRAGFVHASLDGQKLHSRKNTKRVRYSSKNFGKRKGLYADTLTANNVPVNVSLNPLNTHESHNVFDLLYNNTTEININAASTDTHGVNSFNFALLDLSDWEFNPRYKKTKRVFSSMFELVEGKGDNDWSLKLAAPINRKVIEDGWEYVKRVIVSLHQKSVSQKDLVARLSQSSPSDKNLKALREYDRLIKAIYLLNYVNDGQFRQYIQTVLNRGEAYHQLQRYFEKIGDGGGFRGKSDEEIDMWYECSRLMANCIIYFNSVVLNYLLEYAKVKKDDKRTASLARISPVAWVHIVLRGKYPLEGLRDTPDLHALAKVIIAA
ncbi:MAG: Tn3 family transposase [Agarilytica sp.]